MILNLIMMLFFFTIGVSYSTRFRKYEKYVFIFLVLHDITLTTGLVTAFFRATKRIEKIEIASCSISMIMVTWFRLVLQKQKKYLHKTISILTEDSEMKHLTHKKVMKNFSLIIVFIVLSSGMIFLSPILRFVSGTTVDYDESAIYIAPHLFKFRSVRSLMEYMTLVSIQGSMIACNANGCWSYVIFTAYVLCNLQTHIDNINKKFVLMLPSNEKIMENCNTSEDKRNRICARREEIHLSQSCMEKKFVEIIIYQQFFHRYLRDFMKYLYWTYVGTLAWIILTLILTMFAISQIPKDVFFLMKKVAISVNFLLVFYLQCYIGEAVSRLDDSLLASFYNGPWYLLPTAVRKNMVTVMILSQKEFGFNIFGMFSINLKLFTSVGRIIYTVTNILVTSQKNNF